ncbi:MAG: hypothetical protein J6Z14_08365 [Prevotella sp.]|nr:hypothetical protein [Prevotella sp.]
MSYHLEAYLSIRSFQKQLTESDRIFVLTTKPEYYRHAHVDILPIPEQQIEEWQGRHHFFFRVKIMALDYLQQRYPDEHLLYLDSDTFLYGSLETLRQRLDEGKGLMHQREGHPSKMKGGSLKMWKRVAGHTYGGVTLSENHDMWNAGVTGIPAGRARQTIDTSLAICDGMLDDGAKTFILEQYSSSVSMAENTQLCEAADHIGHYWGNKAEWEKLSGDLLLRAYMKESSLDEELEAVTDGLLRSLPIYVHKRSTAEKLHKQIDRLFPKNDFRYIP